MQRISTSICFSSELYFFIDCPIHSGFVAETMVPVDFLDDDFLGFLRGRSPAVVPVL